MNINKIISQVIFGVVILLSVTVSGYAGYRIYKSLPQFKEVLLGKDSNTSNNPLVASANSNKCIVTLFSQKYDVTNLRRTHSGGDIFKCGTDMTQEYVRQHGTDLTRMAKYLIQSDIAVVPTSTSGSTKTKTAGGGFTYAMLATHNTSRSCYVAYRGTVYDVTSNPAWSGCYHHGIRGGRDITSLFPHPTSYLASLRVVGKISGGSGSTKGGSTTTTRVNSEDEFENEDDD